MKKIEKLLMILWIALFVYVLFYFIFFFLFSNGIDFIIAFSFISLLIFLYKQLASYIYISLLNIHKDIWMYYMSLFGLMEVLKNMIINYNKLSIDIIETKVIILTYFIEIFDNNIADMNFFFLNKYFLNRYLSLLFYKLNYINLKKNEINNLPFFLNSLNEYKLYKSYQFILILKLFKEQ